MTHPPPDLDAMLRDTLRHAAGTTRADDDLVERLLARTREGVAPATSHSQRRWLAPTLAAASVAVIAGGIVALTATADGPPPRPAGHPTATSGPPDTGTGTARGTSAGAAGPLPNAVGDCRFAAFEPIRIRLSCHSLRTSVDINGWATWTSTRATGTGDVVRSDCTPTCATGRTTRYAARIALSRPVQAAAGTQFTRLTITYSGATPDGRRVATVTLPTV